MALSDLQIKDLRQIFDWLDSSGDGEVAAPELLVALKATSKEATLQQAEDLIRESAPEKATLDWLEFLGVFEKALAASKMHSSAAQMYELLETKGTGQLGPSALRAALLSHGCDASDHAIDKMIRCVDADGDGQVSLQEYVTALAGASKSHTK